MKILIISIFSIWVLGSACTKNPNNKTMRELLFEAESDGIYLVAKNYNSISDSNKQLLFNEHFNNNLNNWEIIPHIQGVEKAEATIQNGLYSIIAQEAFPANFSINKSIPTSNNFEVEFYFNWDNLPTTGTTVKSTLFCGNDNEMIQIECAQRIRNLQPSVLKNGQVIKSFNTIESYITSQDQFVLITIRKVGKRFLMFVDKSFIGYVETSLSSITKIGFISNTNLNIDFIKINSISF